MHATTTLRPLFRHSCLWGRSAELWSHRRFLSGEISWTLNGAEYGAPYSGIIDLEPGLYTIAGSDSWGDGWNGATMSITDLGSGTPTALWSTPLKLVDVEVTGAVASSCDFDSCAGCTDEAACNYDAEATLDDGLVKLRTT